ncbi:ATP-binding cassette domain-containing protein [Nesterenkonia sp. CL21]|uniref:ATP-binding cassette domain-containing protein n=1 Tax=Nesterenkonia sp. CL21 TaxID=3064894 RepID=UPI002879C9E9|nr:ATP-binding cassette domain-containing protein [Nesterenkonia sp. CL21]MDS2172280.1 ATP-binding cassette domain-containing protein [Nesterenkonia sp. CL21]
MSVHPASPPLVHLQGVEVVTRRTRQTLLSVPDLPIAPASRAAVMGPSGAGKSMLLSALTGRLPAGVEMTGLRRATSDLRIGFVPQRGADAVHPLMPIARQLRAVTGADAARIRQVLAAVGLDLQLLGRRRPAELSGGQLQRVAISLAFLGSPALVIADEPTSALDGASRDETLAVLSELSETTGSALVVATHDPQVRDRLDAQLIRVASGQVALGLDREAEAA